MSRIPDLEAGLIAAAQRRYGRATWRRLLLPGARALAIAGAVCVAAILVASLSDDEGPVEQPAVPSNLGPHGWLPAGDSADPSRLERLRESVDRSVRDAYAIPAPPAAPDSIGSRAKEWIIVPGDRLCVYFGSASGCGTSPEHALSGMIVTTLPGPDEPLEIGPDGTVEDFEPYGTGPATMEGVVPREYVAVVALTQDGEEIARTEIVGQAFSLTVPSAAGLDRVELRRADGSAKRGGG